MKKVMVLLSLCAVASTAMAGFYTGQSAEFDPFEPGLRGVMNKLYGEGNFQRIDDAYDNLWSYASRMITGSAQFEAKFSAIGRATFGYFEGTDSTKFNPLYLQHQGFRLCQSEQTGDHGRSGSQ